MIILQRQPTERTCGQTVCAMIAGVDVARVVAVMRDRRTRIADLRAYLATHGIAVGDLRRWRSTDPAPSGLAVFRVRWSLEPGRKTPRTHWILWDGSRARFFDPSGFESDFSVGDGAYEEIGGKIISCAEVIP